MPWRTVGSLNVAQYVMRDPNSSTALMAHSTKMGMLEASSNPPRSSNHCAQDHCLQTVQPAAAVQGVRVRDAYDTCRFVQ
jgi:hypothetical protein